MAYTALYRKFRPLLFNEMVGQEHITKTIKNQLVAGRVGHAYLFNGGRGTGKTSAAKILARAVNCLNPKDGEPCNECEICKGILAGSLTDIVEMDAASNNGVEDIRSIRETVNFLPSIAKYRIYIIDEVHMLSTGAFNALLKTLEEPPAHVKFILATTEPQKLPATILSRCQRFDFKKISVENVIKRLEIICKESNIEITKEALKLIAVLSEGAMRDAISILERCVQDGEIKITEDKIKELVGIPKIVQIHKLSKAVLEYNVENAIETTEELINEGKELTNLLWEITKYIKDILVYKTSKKLDIYSEEEILEIGKLTELASTERLLKIICELSELENNLKWSNQRQIVFQAGIIKLCSNFANSGYEEIEKRLNNIEEQIQNGILVKKENREVVTNTVLQQTQVEKKPEILQTPIEDTNSSQKKRQTTKIETTTGTTSKELKPVGNWKNIVNTLMKTGKVGLHTNLINTSAKEINDMTVGIEFSGGLTSFAKTIIEKPENMQELVKVVSMEYGKEMRIKLIDGIKTSQKQENQLEALINELDLPINIIEE